MAMGKVLEYLDERVRLTDWDALVLSKGKGYLEVVDEEQPMKGVHKDGNLTEGLLVARQNPMRLFWFMG